MSEPLSPKTFRSADSSPNKLWIVVAAQTCVIGALLAYIVLKPSTDAAAARSEPRYESSRKDPVRVEPLETPQPVTLAEPAAPAPKPASIAVEVPVTADPKKLAETEHPDARLSFRFNYQDKPDQWREWRRMTPVNWQEVEPNGRVTHFTVLSRLKDAQMSGTIVRRTDLKMDVMIPDKTSTRKMYWRYPNGEWVYMGQVSAEATLPANEEF